MDRFYRGLISGIIAGIPMNIWSNITHMLGLGELRFLDWAGIIIYGVLPQTIFQQVYAQIIQLLWLGLLGIVFAFLIPHISSQVDLLKGIFFSLSAGFVIYAIPVLYKVPHLMVLDTLTVLNNHIGGVIWGASLAYVLRKLDTSPRE